MSDWRRCEILLPLKFNDGQPVPRQLLGQTLLELEERFGAVSCEAQIIHGIWRHQGQRFRDDELSCRCNLARWAINPTASKLLRTTARNLLRRSAAG